MLRHLRAAVHLAILVTVAASGLAVAAEPVCRPDVGDCEIAGGDEAFIVGAEIDAASISIGYDRPHGGRPSISCVALNEATRRTGIAVEPHRYGARILIFPGELTAKERRMRLRWSCTMDGDRDGDDAYECPAAGGGCIHVRGGVGGTGGTWAGGAGGEVQIIGGPPGVSNGPSMTIGNSSSSVSIGAPSSYGYMTGASGGASITGGPTIGARGGDARVAGGLGEPGGSVYLETGGVRRVWLDHGGTLHYNGAEVATMQDVNNLPISTGVAGLLGAFTGTMLAIWLYGASRSARWRERIAQVRAWRASQKRSPDDGAYRGTNNCGPL